ncbi:MAG: NTP transferase domain-containing protein [Bacteroidetes bacterium]|nr:NTP transferase domain-containing protein [Bacteroidota bacterium]MDA1120366.1 NTP transferase domain-containing protein [Bacteroidota bacterium]
MITSESKKHQKHAKLTKPTIGSFHRNEWAIIGTSCDQIKKMAFEATESLSGQLKIAYIDADHKSADTEIEEGRDQKSILAHGGQFEFTDKITFQRFDVEGQLSDYKLKPLFQDNDLVLVNGNHFQANRQILVIDPKNNLEKHLDKLTNVGLILLNEEASEIPELMLSKLNLDSIPVKSVNEPNVLTDFLREEWSESIPKVKGLVLAGGQSTRMGRDKGKINYHGKDQRIFMLEQLHGVTDSAYISIREDQLDELDDHPVLTDKFIGLGPYGAILSAFQSDPNSAWLVVACDQPNIDAEILSHLVSNRDATKMATCYHNPETNFPEPLITLWEPQAYPILLHFLSLGFSCPRKVIINSDCKIIQAPDVRILKNVNTPEELEKVVGN